MIGSFVIFLREALEASLIVSILLAALRQLGQPQLMRAVWIGVIAAVVASFGGANGPVDYILTVGGYHSDGTPDTRNGSRDLGLL